METHCENCKGWDCSACRAPGGRLHTPRDLVEMTPAEFCEGGDEFEQAFIDAITRPIGEYPPIRCMFCHEDMSITYEDLGGLVASFFYHTACGPKPDEWEVARLEALAEIEALSEG